MPAPVLELIHSSPPLLTLWTDRLIEDKLSSTTLSLSIAWFPLYKGFTVCSILACSGLLLVSLIFVITALMCHLIFVWILYLFVATPSFHYYVTHAQFFAERHRVWWRDHSGSPHFTTPRAATTTHKTSNHTWRSKKVNRQCWFPTTRTILLFASNTMMIILHVVQWIWRLHTPTSTQREKQKNW